MDQDDRPKLAERLGTKEERKEGAWRVKKPGHDRHLSQNGKGRYDPYGSIIIGSYDHMMESGESGLTDHLIKDQMII